MPFTLVFHLFVVDESKLQPVGVYDLPRLLPVFNTGTASSDGGAPVGFVTV